MFGVHLGVSLAPCSGAGCTAKASVCRQSASFFSSCEQSFREHRSAFLLVRAGLGRRDFLCSVMGEGECVGCSARVYELALLVDLQRRSVSLKLPLRFEFSVPCILLTSWSCPLILLLQILPAHVCLPCWLIQHRSSILLPTPSSSALLQNVDTKELCLVENHNLHC